MNVTASAGFKKPDGKQGWSYILSFYEKQNYKKFQEVTLKALDAFKRQVGGNENGKV